MINKKRGVRFPLRIVIAGLLLILQIAVLIYFSYFLSINSLYIYSIFTLCGILMVIYIVSKPGNESYKMTWVVFILLAPVLGVFFYFLRGGSRFIPNVRQRRKIIFKETRPLLVQDTEVTQKLKYTDIVHSRQSEYLYRESGFPVYDNTDVKFLYPGEVIWEEMLKELEKAEEKIFIEFFILAEGVMWDEIHKILIRKAAQGVDIRIIFDDFGSINRQYKGFMNGLRSENIKVEVFNPIRASLDTFMNNRNHRKIVVIDGKVAFTGGFNIGDEYINKWQRFGYWMDSAVKLTGDAAYGFMIMFLEMWSFVTKKRFNRSLYPKPENSKCGDGFVHPYCDGPFNEKNPAQGLYMQMITSAQKYVYITTPYLIIDSEMATILKLAAKSGIDVRIITPSIGDKWYVHPVTRSNYKELIKSGIRIYEYSPGFIHSKMFVSDDKVATVGTVNMDYRSFYFHFECGAWICANNAVLEVRDHIKELFEQSKEITTEDIKNRTFYQRLKQTILRLFAPFM